MMTLRIARIIKEDDVNIEVIRQEEDGLRRKVWRFSFSTPSCCGKKITAYLESYTRETRKTKRHSWQSAVWYSRFFAKYKYMGGENLEIPEDVFTEGKQLLVNIALKAELKEVEPHE